MNNNKNTFTVKFDTEYFSNWVKSEGLHDGVFLENQEVKVDIVSIEDGYLNIEGTLTTRWDG